MDKQTVLKYVLFTMVLTLVVLIMDRRNKMPLDVTYRESASMDDVVERDIIVHVANVHDLIIPLHVTVHHNDQYLLNGYEEIDMDQEAKLVYYTFSLLTNLSNYLPEGVKTLVPRSTKLIEYEKYGKYLILNVSRDFYNYSKVQERNMLSIISHTFKETLGVDFIKILVEGQTIKYHDYGYVWMYYQDFILNPVSDPIESQTPLVVYYYVPIGESYFLTPVTYYVHPISDVKSRIEHYLSYPDTLAVWTIPEDEELIERQYLVTLMQNELIEKDELVGHFNEFQINLY